MKRIYILTISLLFLITSFANAALVDNGDGTITDTNAGLIWLKDANYAFTSGYDDDGLMTWDEAMIWAEDLVFAGYSDWRLPDSLDQGSTYFVCVAYNCTESEMGHLYYIELGNLEYYDGCTLGVDCGLVNTGPFENLQSYYYWSETERWALPSQAWDFNFEEGRQYPYDKTFFDYAWAVRTITPELIRILGKPGYYLSFQAAYDAAVDGDIIQSQDIISTEDLFIDEISNKTVSIEGGYNSDFSSIIGKATINGNMTISNGTLLIEKGVLEVI